MRHRLLVGIVALFLLFLGPTRTTVRAQSDVDRINSFHSDITINQNGSLSIRETLEYETTLSKHGIYRYIPFLTRNQGLIVRNSLDDLRVTDENGSPVQFSRSRDDGNLVLKIGDPNVTFSGTKIYVIAYTARDAVQATATGPRLVWDITGEGWKIPVQRTSVQVHSPYAPITMVDCYSGPFGGDDGRCTVSTDEQSSAAFAYDTTIDYGDNVTVDVLFAPENQLALPTLRERQLQMLRENFWIVLLPLPSLALFYVWYRKGRDYMFVGYNVFDHSPRPTVMRPLFSRFPVPMVYEPLDITPGQAGAILDERYDTTDLVADILDLARKKFLRIDQTKEKTWRQSADYSFTKLKDADQTLPAHQRKILQGMFGSASSTSLSSMKGTFYVHLEKIRSAVFASLFDKTMFTRDPIKTKTTITLILFGGSFIAMFVLIPLMQSLSFASPVAIIGLLVQAPLLVLLIMNMNQKTAKGFNYMQQARGLRETIARGKWREEIKEKHLFVEEVLPFAVALGVVDKLSSDMRDLSIEPPSYLQTSSLHTWNNAAFLSTFSREVGSGMTYNPSSSSSGGGGSGGGGGGGGGGSW